MAEYISTFTTGFADVIPIAIQKLLPGAKVIHVYDGLVNYTYTGKEDNIHKVLVFNNTFLVIRKYQGKSCSMDLMIKNAISVKRLPASEGSFRIRYSVNNQFVGVNKSFTRQIEEKISRITNSHIDRVSPQTEYWFLQRSENIGFFCRLLGKRKFTEKNLHKGELRPEFTYLMCMLGEIKKDSIVLDPFVGYGSIPKQLTEYFPYKKIIVSDVNSECIANLKNYFKNIHNVEVSVRNALDMQDIITSSIDVIITDPPWGYYEDIDNIELFYVDMLKEFDRVQKDEGGVVILSARKSEFVNAVSKSKYHIITQYNTLVNGKKAAVYVIKK